MSLYTFLSEFVTPERINVLQSVLAQRTRYLTVVLENLYDTQNASAVLRTCECMGVQDVHIIENCNDFEVRERVVQGSAKWLSINQYNQQENNTISTLAQLKTEGYRIVATTPNEGSVSLSEFDMTKGKVALVFGQEAVGISQDVLDNADEFLSIPILGFTESYNISVAVAIILNDLIQQGGVKVPSTQWKLTQEEKEVLELDWLKKSIKKVEMLVDKYEEKHPKSLL